MTYELLKLLHLLGAAILFGTGVGIAFFLFAAVQLFAPAEDAQGALKVAGVCRLVVIADYVFTLTAVVLQPVTGLTLLYLVGYQIAECWISLSLLLYVLIGMCWIPVVFMQIEMRDLADQAARNGTALSPRFFVLYKRWFLLGWPAFFMMLGIYWLMIVKPTGAYCLG